MIQHYVPRVHLKFFAKEVKNEFIVDVYEKQTNRQFKTNIKNICAEKHFYTLDEDQKVANDILAIENIYGNFLEPIYRKAYDILTDNRIIRITHQQHNEILIGIFQMYMRNPKLLRNLIDFNKSEINKKYKLAIKNKIKGLTHLEEDFSFKECSINDIIKISIAKITKDYKERHILGTKDICMFHLNAKYEVSEIIDDAEFFTSDNPLVTEDLIDKSENPLLKSKEFYLPLNKKFALRVFHDNTKKINFIYRHKIPNGNANLINDNIFKNSSRFIIGDKKGFSGFFEMKKYFDSTSLDLKMDAIRQIITKGLNNSETEETKRFMTFYLNKYDKDGTLSKVDQYKFFTKISGLSAEWKKSRLI